MHKSKRPDLSPGRRTRSCSMSTQGSSLPGSMIACPPISSNPAPAYVAMSAASQLVSAGLELDGVTIESSALAQLNSFIDYVLFNILLTAKSTQLGLLRPAVHGVLKAKLGRAALAGANEELKEYLGDDDDEEDDQAEESDRHQRTKREFDLELAWKLARLRCMVYSRLGDLEEDDEDDYIERENLDERGGRPRRFSSHPSRVTTAAAIFLTSVLEFIAEQALAYATEATHRKLSKAQPSRGPPDPLASMFFPPDRVVVSDADMRHLGRDSPLQKLWRSWRHQVRPSTDLASRSISPESLMVVGASRKASFNAGDERTPPDTQKQPSMGEVLQETDPAWIPLPMTENDVNEIEMSRPGSPRHQNSIVPYESGPDSDTSRKPRSVDIPPPRTKSFAPGAPDDSIARARLEFIRPTLARPRSRSLSDVRHFSSHGSPFPVDRHPTTHGSPPRGSGRPNAGIQMGTSIPETQLSSDASVKPLATGTLPGEYGARTSSMPGTHPHNQSVDGIRAPMESTSNGQGALATPNERDTLAKQSVLPASGRSLGPGRAPESPPKMYEPVAVGPAVLSRTHPLRSLSKPEALEIERNQQGEPPPANRVSPTSMGPPRLTRPPPVPPPEMSKRVQETPNGIPPASPTRDTQKRQGQVVFPTDTVDMRPGSKSSDHTKSSSSSSKLLGFDRAQQSASQTGADLVPDQRSDLTSGLPGGSDAFAAPGTQQDTRGSRLRTGHPHMSSSKQAASASTPANPNNNAGYGRGARSGYEQNGTARSVDNAVPSDQASKSRPSPRNVQAKQVAPSRSQRSTTQDLADFCQDTAPAGDNTKLQSVTGSINGLRSNPPEPTALPPVVSNPVPSSRPTRTESASSMSPTARSTKSHHQPREPTVGNPNTRDLADFAKSTGPEDPGQLSKMVSGGDLPRPKRTKSKMGRSQARDPVIRGGSSDLIDFIREGPPRGVGDDPRIPRTVVPVRSTMDPDELDTQGGPASDLGARYSGSSNQDGSILTKSTVNSRTGLIDSRGRLGFNPSNASHRGASQVPKRLVGESMPAKRKPVKNKDPYAIDVDSDDEIDDGTGRSAREGEESLIDFLRNTSPPPESQFQPQPLSLSANPIPAQVPNVLRRPVAGGFRDRLRRTASSHNLHRNSGVSPSASASDRTNSSARAKNTNQQTSPRPAQSGSRFDSYRPTQDTYAAQVDRSRYPGASHNIDDDKEEGNFSKLFSRKRRVAA